MSSPSESNHTGLRLFIPHVYSYETFSAWRREYLGFPNPGTIENLQKEVKSTHLTNFIFDGARADITKAVSMNPAFQLTHSFALGSSTAPPTYNFGAVVADAKSFMQGNVDHDGNLSARINHGWSPNNVTKMQTSLSASRGGNSMFQLEHDYLGLDYSLNVKAINPSPIDGSGAYFGNYLQSVSKHLALGAESVYQTGPSPLPGMPPISELSTSYIAKYTGQDWIATAQVQPAGVLQTTFWQKLGEKLEIAADLQLVAVRHRRDAIATVGAKYSLRQAMFRAQVDTTGKVSALLEQQLAPAFAFMVAGELDHVKSTAKVGLGIMIEASAAPPEELAGQPGYPPPY
ncbi:hypothetical protein DL93DRAFT_2207932 [Clavulina sp. PMI_390]|nr:hypothetical protein DL93DRAFT_2207932 [Clavulina sp. PMI_390]